jgi:spermidine synthase
MLRAFLALSFISGFSVVALETIWIHQLSLEVGGSVVSSSLVIGIFFVAAAVGGLLARRLLAIPSCHPIVLYGVLEISFTLATCLFEPSRQWARDLFLIGSNDQAAWAMMSRRGCMVAMAVSLPAIITGAMLPVLSQAFIGNRCQRTTIGGRLYSAGLIGAAGGAMLGGAVLPTFIGYAASAMTMAAMNFLVGVIALVIPRFSSTNIPANAQHREQVDGQDLVPPAFAAIIVATSGFCTIALELLVLLYVHQLTLNSVYMVAMVLSAFIMGFGLAAAFAAWLRHRAVSAKRMLQSALFASGVMALLYPGLFQGLISNPPELFIDLMHGIAWWPLIAVFVLLLPLLLCIGSVFPLALEHLKMQRAEGQVIGRAITGNKIGAALGAMSILVSIPLLGLPGAFGLIGCMYLGLVVMTMSRWRRRAALIIPLAIAASLQWPPPTREYRSEQCLDIAQNAAGIVSVVEDEHGSRHIRLNQRYTLNGSQRSLSSQRHESWLPLFLAADARRVAFIGMGSGISAGAALDFPIDELVAIELVADVGHMARKHFSKWNNCLFDDARASIVVDDGRCVLANSTSPFDVVICDLLLATNEGTASLYSRDFFRTVGRTMAAEGIFCLWLPCYELDAELIGIVCRTYTEEFPNVLAIRANFTGQQVLGLLGSRTPFDLSSQFIQGRLASREVRELAQHSLFFRNEESARMMVVADLHAAAELFARHPATTDDHPVFAFRGPKAIAAGEALVGWACYDWLEQFTPSDSYPSCHLGDTPAKLVQLGSMAGRYCLAASLAGSVSRGDLSVQVQPTSSALRFLQQAVDIQPNMQISLDDLGD